MELVAALAVFYLGYSVVLLSPAATIFRSFPGGGRWIRGERITVASVWPARIDVIAERLLPGEWIQMPKAGDESPGGADGPQAEVAVNGRSIVVDGRALLRLSTPAGANRLRSMLSNEECDTHRKTSPGLARVLRRSLLLDRARTRVKEVLGESRYLGIYNSLYLVILFVIVPLLILRWNENGVWLLVLPVIAALHLGATVEFWRLHGLLLDTTAEERVTEVLMGLLFPPALLRSRHEVVQAALCGVHPAAIAAVMLDGETLRRFLAGEIAYVDGCHDGRPSQLLAVERRGLIQIAEAAGWSEPSLRQARDRRDPTAACYCPRCDSEFVSVIGNCSDCESRTLAYPTRALP